MAAISEPFSLVGSSKSKLLVLHASRECSGSLSRVIRSLTSEHVIAENLLSLEKARSTPLGAALRRAERDGRAPNDETVLSVLRRWFWSRSADQGFCVSGFPRNRRQALALDEWLDARNETLDAVVWSRDASPEGDEVAAYYREHGLLVEAQEIASS